MFLLQPGQKGCLAPGAAYREAARITRSGLPGRPVRLQGNGASLHGGIAVTANDVVVGGVRIHGLGEQRAGIVVVRGARVAILRNEIVGKDIVKTTPCVFVDRADGTTIDGNVIVECARAIPRTASSQGIFVRNSTGTTIANNVVSGTPGDGIAVAYSSRTSVVRNHVNGNSNGVYLGPSATETLVVDNLLTYSGRHNVHGGGGFANLVTGNCIWRAAAGNVAGGGFLAVGNFVGSPRYVNRFRSLAMRAGPCTRLRPASGRTGERSHGTPVPVMPRVRVHYRLLGFPRRVNVVRLFVSRAVPGATVTLRCLRGCRAAERRGIDIAGRAGLVSLGRRWLSRGTMVELRVTRPGWAGRVARVRVVGAPRGVRVAHFCLAPGSSAVTSCARLARS
jgi:parallel beta-helix repeat protein